MPAAPPGVAGCEVTRLCHTIAAVGMSQASVRVAACTSIQAYTQSTLDHGTEGSWAAGGQLRLLLGNIM
jgi:hypothetical protein